jgi:hypothetical protein
VRLLLTRPFDAVLIALPVGLYLVLSLRGVLRRLVSSVGCIIVGSAGPLLLALVLNAHLTAHMFTFSEAVNGGIQTFGFGHKRLAHGTTLVSYSFAVAMRSLGRNLLSLPKFFFGGVVAVALAIWGLSRSRLGLYRVVLLGIAIVFPVGYVFWWGSLLSAGARNSIGPHYYMPMMVPVAILAADVLVDAWRRRALLAGGVVAIMVAATVAVLPSTFSGATFLPDAFRRDHAVIARARLSNALVFLPRSADNTNHVLRPFPYLQNRPDLSGPVLYASEHGPADFRLLNEYPTRVPYQFVASVPEGSPDILHASFQVVRLTPQQGQNLVVDLREVNPNDHAPSAFAYAALDGHIVTTMPLSRTSSPGAVYRVRWSLGSGVLHLLSADGQPTTSTPIQRQGTLAFGMGFGQAGSPQTAELVERRLYYRLAHGVSQVLLPADDPDQARSLLAEALQLATALGYESPFELSSAVFCAARLQEWPTTLRFIGRVLHHHARSGTVPLYVLAAHLNLAAHGLAEHQPEPAAILQGAVGALIRRLAPDVAAPVGGRTSTPNDVAALVIEVRRDTTRFLTAALGEPRMRRLRAEGAAMNEDQACTYARAHIDEYLRQASQAVS